MGGLLDATNVCKSPLCTIIASISMDHTQFLGDTLQKIYSQKLGIMKKNVPCVAYPVNEDLMTQWIEKCDENATTGSSVMVNPSDIGILHSGLDGSSYIYKGNTYDLAVPGIYQIYNSVVAVETAYMLQKEGYDLKNVNISEGLAATRWKGRFQKLMDVPPVYVDGAHNPGGWRALRKNIDTYFPGRDLIYICGVFRDKDYRQMLEIMMPGAGSFIAVQPDNPRALSNRELGELAKMYIDSVYVQDDVDDAVEQALRISSEVEDPVVIIFGSLSFIGPIIDRAEHGCYKKDYHH